MSKENSKDDFKVNWDKSVCIHAGICAKGLPNVFKPTERPWIQTENESHEKIREQVAKCPSGALSISETKD